MKNLEVKLTLILFVIVSSTLNINSQSGIVISPGAKMGMNGDIFVKLHGDCSMANNSDYNQFGGKIIFSGDSYQYISGNEASEFNVLEINNPVSVIAENDVTVHNELLLNEGILNIFENNLLIKEAASVSGIFSASNMIIAENDGVMYYEVPVTGTYIFPLGDQVSGNKFTPASISLNSGSFNNALLGMNLKAEKHPDNPSITNYLNRFWSVYISGVSGFNADVEFNYGPTDIVGNEENIVGALWTGTLWYQIDPAVNSQLTGNVNEFGDFSGVDESLFSDIKTIQNTDINIYYTTGRIYMENNSNSKIKYIKIYSVTGELLVEQAISFEEGYYAFSPPVFGIYLVSFITDKGFYDRKLLMY